MVHFVRKVPALDRRVQTGSRIPAPDRGGARFVRRAAGQDGPADGGDPGGGARAQRQAGEDSRERGGAAAGGCGAAVREVRERRDRGGGRGDRRVEIGIGVCAGEFELAENDDGDKAGGYAELGSGGEVFGGGGAVSAED